MSNDFSFTSKIENLLGLTVDITLNNKKCLTGNIFTINPKANIIVLINTSSNNNNSFSISIVNIIEIKKIELSADQIDIKADELCVNDLKYIKDKEKRNLEKDNLIKKADTEPNFKRGLEVYEALSKLYRCSYDGKKILLDDIGCYIEEPFKMSNLYCKDEKIRERLEKMISFSIKKKNK